MILRRARSGSERARARGGVPHCSHTDDRMHLIISRWPVSLSPIIMQSDVLMCRSVTWHDAHVPSSAVSSALISALRCRAAVKHGARSLGHGRWTGLLWLWLVCLLVKQMTKIMCFEILCMKI